MIVICFAGPPGTGKTSLCKALAQKLSIVLSDRYKYGQLIEINSHSLFSKWFSEVRLQSQRSLSFWRLIRSYCQITRHCLGNLCHVTQLCIVLLQSVYWEALSVPSLYQGCTSRWPDLIPKRLISVPCSRFNKYKKLLVNDGDFMNVFKCHWTTNNFETYYNLKQLWWQQYHTTSIKGLVFDTSLKESSYHYFVFGPWVH